MVDLNALRSYLNNRNVRAMLRVIRQRESSQDDSAYTVINGGQHFEAPPWRHPWHGIPTTQGARASGAYQFLGTTWAEVYERYGLTDFSPLSQDLGAVGLLVRRGALDDVVAGRFADAVRKCRLEWTSLPGASESSAGWTMDKALAVYAEYGGTLATQPAAPIEDRSTEEEKPMGTVALPLLQMILPQIIGLFSGKAQAKISQVTGADPVASEQFLRSLMAQVGQASGVPITNDASALQAVAAITASRDAVQVKALEDHSLDYLDKLSPLLDKLAAQEREVWKANDDSADRAAKRGQSDAVDFGPMLAKWALVIFAVTAVIVGGVMVVQVFVDPTHKVDGVLIGLLTILVYAGARIAESPFRYRFGGVSESTVVGSGNELVRDAGKQQVKP